MKKWQKKTRTTLTKTFFVKQTEPNRTGRTYGKCNSNGREREREKKRSIGRSKRLNEERSVANSIGYGILNNVDFMGNCYEFYWIFQINLHEPERKSKVTRVTQLFGRYLTRSLWRKFVNFDYFIDIFWGCICVYVNGDWCFERGIFTRSHKVFRFYLYLLTNHIKWLEENSVNMRNVIFDGEKAHRKANTNDINILCDVIEADGRELGSFQRKFVISLNAFLSCIPQALYVHITMRVCYLFSPSNYSITARVSICWQRKCMLWMGKESESERDKQWKRKRQRMKFSAIGCISRESEWCENIRMAWWGGYFE